MRFHMGYFNEVKKIVRNCIRLYADHNKQTSFHPLSSAHHPSRLRTLSSFSFHFAETSLK